MKHFRLTLTVRVALGLLLLAVLAPDQATARERVPVENYTAVLAVGDVAPSATELRTARKLARPVVGCATPSNAAVADGTSVVQPIIVKLWFSFRWRVCLMPCSAPDWLCDCIYYYF